jgi:hypothetical protein
MRAVCSITRAPILIRRFRIVANSQLASGWCEDRGAHAVHQPERSGVENQPHLIGRRAVARHAVNAGVKMHRFAGANIHQ